jgi:CoA:oxalate CoA-transferase
VPGPLGARHPSITPFEPYETADGLLIIAGGNDSLYRKLAAVLEHPEWIEDERFRTNDLRSRNADALKTEIEAVLTTKPRADWVELLDRAGIPCGPINTIDQTLQHPQVAARNMVVTVDDPVTGPLKVSGNPIKISGFADPDHRSRAPDLDADRAAILAGLGFGD